MALRLSVIQSPITWFSLCLGLFFPSVKLQHCHTEPCYMGLAVSPSSSFLFYCHQRLTYTNCREWCSVPDIVVQETKISRNPTQLPNVCVVAGVLIWMLFRQSLRCTCAQVSWLKLEFRVNWKIFTFLFISSLATLSDRVWCSQCCPGKTVQTCTLEKSNHHGTGARPNTEEQTPLERSNLFTLWPLNVVQISP